MYKECFVLKQQNTHLRVECLSWWNIDGVVTAFSIRQCAEQHELERWSLINIPRKNKSKGNKKQKKKAYAQSLTPLLYVLSAYLTSICFNCRSCPFLLITCSSTSYSWVLSLVQAPSPRIGVGVSSPPPATHVYTLGKIIQDRKDEGLTRFFFLDVQKAYDTAVWRNGLWKKLWAT